MKIESSGWPVHAPFPHAEVAKAKGEKLQYQDTAGFVFGFRFMNSVNFFKP